MLGAGPGYGAWIDSFELPLEQRLAGADADGDGVLNAGEYMVDSLPNVASNEFVCSFSGSSIEWGGSSNCTYTVLRSTNLATQAFIPVEVLPGEHGPMEFQDSADLAEAFYQLEVERK